MGHVIVKKQNLSDKHIKTILLILKIHKGRVELVVEKLDYRKAIFI